MLFRVANVAVDDSSLLHDKLRVERQVVNIDLLCVTNQIVEFVNINSIARVRNYFVKPLPVFFNGAALDEFADQLDVIVREFSVMV